MSGPEHAVELTHGYTYSAHPLACAAGLATLDIYRDEKLFERARELEPKFADAVMSLRKEPGVLDIRTVGLTAGIDLAPIADLPGKRGFAGLNSAFHDNDLMLRVAGDTGWEPVLIVTILLALSMIPLALATQDVHLDRLTAVAGLGGLVLLLLLVLAAGSAQAELPALIPREILFGNPARADRPLGAVGCGSVVPELYRRLQLSPAIRQRLPTGRASPPRSPRGAATAGHRRRRAPP
jgi:hypothetical protein